MIARSRSPFLDREFENIAQCPPEDRPVIDERFNECEAIASRNPQELEDQLEAPSDVELNIDDAVGWLEVGAEPETTSEDLEQFKVRQVSSGPFS